MLDPEKYINCAYYMLHKFRLPKDEYLDIALMGVLNACRTFDEEKMKNVTPQTYVCFGVQNELKNEARREIRFHHNVSTQRGVAWHKYLKEERQERVFLEGLDEPVMEQLIGFDQGFLEEIESNDVVERFMSHLTKQEKQVLTYRMKELNHEEIGKKMGFTKQYSQRILKNVKDKALFYFGEKKCCPGSRSNYYVRSGTDYPKVLKLD